EDEHADEHAHEDEHADEHAHDHGDGNPHVFTDPGTMMEITRILADRFAAHWPEEADAIRAAETAYLTDLAALDAEIATLLAPVAGQAFVPFHDAWSSFAAHYDLNLVMEIEPFPGREPSARQLAEAIDVLAEYDARAIFSEVQLPDRPARVLADEAGVRLGILDPLGGGEGREGYLATMRYNAQTIRDALSAD
ncbi:MAG: metal ABC transporter substrate-binding protein, partial [Trueperaceae bacterium]|nr:metal ABC transporter substrate-binding protein [Trueperaceae bacterium]